MFSKKSFMKLLSLVLAMTVLVTMNVNFAFAASKDNSLWIVKKDQNNKVYLLNTKSSEMIVQVFGYNDLGELENIDLTKYVVEKNNPKQETIIKSRDNQSTPLQIMDNQSAKSVGEIITYRYNESYTWKGRDPWQKVTPDMPGPCNISVCTSVTDTESFSSTGGINWDIKNVIKAAASFTWVTSAASATAVTGNWPVPAGKVGYMMFGAYENCTTGTLIRTITYTSPGIPPQVRAFQAAGYSPKTLTNGILDGRYELILADD